MNRKFFKRGVTERLFWCLLLAPSVLIVTLFIIVPILDSICKSFTDYKIINIIKGMNLSGEESYALFKSKYPKSDANNPWRRYR